MFSLLQNNIFFNPRIFRNHNITNGISATTLHTLMPWESPKRKQRLFEISCRNIRRPSTSHTHNTRSSHPQKSIRNDFYNNPISRTRGKVKPTTFTKRRRVKKKKKRWDLLTPISNLYKNTFEHHNQKKFKKFGYKESYKKKMLTRLQDTNNTQQLDARKARTDEPHRDLHCLIRLQ